MTLEMSEIPGAAQHPAGRDLAWGPARVGDGRVSFRLWAPGQARIRLRLRDAELPMRKDGGGWHCLEEDAEPGDTYCFIMLDGTILPDPASRWQRSGVDGLSMLAGGQYHWRHPRWRGRPWHETTIYELHVGTFSEDGTFAGAMPHLASIAECGFTAIEIMPVATFQGDRGWGYDGILQYAPHPAYGTPDELRQLVDEAHGHGLQVFLDVVYNHFGPLGNLLERCCPDFFRAEGSPWGPAPDLSRPEVRQYFIDNALYWLRDFRFDGLRFDASDLLIDPDTGTDLFAEAATSVRGAIVGRHVHLMAEDARNVAAPMRKSESGEADCRAQWNDDFHHVAHVIATGESQGLYANFSENSWTRLRRALAEGFVYQGQCRPEDGKAVGEPSADLHPVSFINFLQNHDQVGNRLRGDRLLQIADEQMVRALTEILLPCPQIPMMFMGEEFGSRQPFCLFFDHPADLHQQEREGKLEQARLFQDMHGESVADVPDPNALETFLMSRLDRGSERSGEAAKWRDFVAGLLTIRRRHIWPLLADGIYKDSASLADAEGCVAVDWRFSSHTLQLRANLGEDAAVLPTVNGTRIHGDWTGRDGTLGARTLLFAVADADKALPNPARSALNQAADDRSVA